MSSRQKGFTLVELIMAAALFSFVLLFVVTSFVQINRAFNRGITTKRIQQSTRQIVEELSRAIAVSGVQNGSTNITINADVDSGCLYVSNGLRYLWNVGFVDRDAGEYSFMRDRTTGLTCDGSNPVPANNSYEVVEFLDEKVAVQDITIAPIAGNPNAYSIEVTLSSNTEDLVTGTGAEVACNVGSGDQFCDTSYLRTVITVRD